MTSKLAIQSLCLIAIVTTLGIRVAEGRLQTADITQVAWIQGCWERNSPQSTAEEHWMAPRGDNMVGMNRSVRDGRLGSHEFLIMRQQDGRIAYEAHPYGQAATVFLSITVEDGLVVFENAEHDFPQRIGYRRVGADALEAWIEGTLNGQPRRIDFPFQRAACPGEH